MLIGSHLSIAGGMDAAVERAADMGMRCLALFVRNQVQWRVPPLGDDAVRRFRNARRRRGISPVVAHGSYLVNLAGDDGIRRRSIDAMVADLERCGRMGIEYLVFHPGAADGASQGVARIADAIDEILDRCEPIRPKLLLETTAGQGRSIGHRFEQLAAIRAKVRRKRRVGVCLDTAHVFAAGYDLRTPRAWRNTLKALDDAVGIEQLLAVHLNDSKRPLGSRVDRHEHIGHGEIGRKGFAHVVNEPRLAEIPMILETPKKQHPSGRSWDEVNFETVRSLCKR